VFTYQCMYGRSDKLNHYSAFRPTYLSKQQPSLHDFLLPFRTCSLFLIYSQHNAEVWRSACAVTRNFNVSTALTCVISFTLTTKQTKQGVPSGIISLLFHPLFPTSLYLCVATVACPLYLKSGVVWCPPTAQWLDQHLVVTQTSIKHSTF